MKKTVKAGDSKALDADTEAARQKLMKQRAEEKRERELEILRRQNELKKMKKTVKAGDSKALDADTEAARQKLMKQRAEEKRERELEILRRQNELKR